ncbi:MAG TPA: dihydrodipicolinate synthase family protein [Gemmatimonadales bacterium]
MQLKGVLAAATTPFDDATGDVDIAAFRRNARFLLDAPLAGLVLFGSTGEGVYVDRDERPAMLRAAREMLGERLLLAGAGAESTRAAIALCRDAAAAGADAVLVQPPGFFRSLMSAPALVAHYSRVADASPLPVVLYQVPAPFRSVELDLALVARLAEHPNIVGVKDSSGDVTAIREMARSCGDGFAVIVGTAAVLLDALDAGACAGILALGAIAPHECAEIHRLWQGGEREEAARLQAVAAQLLKAVVGRFSVPGVKAALDALGLPGGMPRSPMQPLGPAERALVDAAMQAALQAPRQVSS